MRNRMKKIAIAILCLLITPLSCSLFQYDVQYRVTGSAANADLGYNTNSGYSQTTATPLPWTYSFSAIRGDRLFLEAKVGAGGGSLTIEILIDGKVMRSDTASGAGMLIDWAIDVGES
jgi:hypothetical protein